MLDCNRWWQPGHVWGRWFLTRHQLQGQTLDPFVWLLPDAPRDHITDSSQTPLVSRIAKEATSVFAFDSIALESSVKNPSVLWFWQTNQKCYSFSFWAYIFSLKFSLSNFSTAVLQLSKSKASTASRRSDSLFPCRSCDFKPTGDNIFPKYAMKDLLLLHRRSCWMSDQEKSEQTQNPSIRWVRSCDCVEPE